MSRLIVGNLDAESELAAASRGSSEHGNPPQLSLEARRTISAFATLLRAFAGMNDHLWTPTAVDPARLVEVYGLPRPQLATGPLRSAADGQVLAWAETPSVEALRQRAEGEPPVDIEGPLREVLWRLPAADSRAVIEANHRGFSLGAARDLGCALPGARCLRDPGELEAHLRRGGADASRDRRWVIKAPYSAAGRWRLVGQGDFGRESRAAPAARRTIENLFSSFGELLFEPWMDRTEDFGGCALVSERTSRFLGAHRQEVDRQGRFRSVELRAGLRPSEEEALRCVVDHLAGKLRELGYRGPFGVDCWRYRDREGVECFRPLGELNVRMSFGLVARALAERVAPECDSTSRLVSLRLDRSDPGQSPRDEGVEIRPLLLPGGDDPSAAWLEVSECESDTA